MSSLFKTSDTIIANCYLFNAQSIVNKIAELHHISYVDKCDLVFITETWLTPHITSGLLDPQSNFTIIRKDRNNSRGGGVCAFVKNSYCVVPLTIPSKYDALEAIGFDLLFYRRPYYDSSAECLAANLVDFLKDHATCGNRCHIVVGDLNLPRINWINLSCSNDNISSLIFSFVINNGSSQLINFNTRRDSLLEVIFTDDYRHGEMILI